MKKLSQARSIANMPVAGGLIVGALIAPVVLGSLADAQSLGQLRSQAAALEKRIAANHHQAERLENQGESLQNRIAGLDLDIATTTDQIELTEVKIAKLEQELKETQAELERQKGLLKANILALYKRGDATPIELVAGSEDFSGYIDEQEYLERIKLGIQESAQKVVELEEKITAQRDEQKELLAQQEAARQSLNETRGQKAELLEQTQGQEARYRKIVAGLEAKRAAVDRELTALIAASQHNNLGSVSDGKIIGRVGSTGFSTGPHLHFEMRNSAGEVVNPYGSMGGMPVGGYISQSYGCVAPYGWYVTKCSNGNSLHPGLDIVAPHGAPVRATKPGIIIFRGWDGAYGNKVVLKHNDDTFSVYGHLSSF